MSRKARRRPFFLVVSFGSASSSPLKTSTSGQGGSLRISRTTAKINSDVANLLKIMDCSMQEAGEFIASLSNTDSN